jgi:hypothetical protein
MCLELYFWLELLNWRVKGEFLPLCRREKEEGIDFFFKKTFLSEKLSSEDQRLYVTILQCLVLRKVKIDMLMKWTRLFDKVVYLNLLKGKIFFFFLKIYWDDDMMILDMNDESQPLSIFLERIKHVTSLLRDLPIGNSYFLGWYLSMKILCSLLNLLLLL